MNMRQQPADVAVQILLWSHNGHRSHRVVNALGLGLRINPGLFEAFFGRGRRQSDPRFAQMGGFVAIVVRHYSMDKLEAVPIVLIACKKVIPGTAIAVEAEIGDVFPFQYPTVKTYPSYTG